MKCSIEGFNQAYAAGLSMDVVRGGKTVTQRIDCIDLVILRWFTDFYPDMRKVKEDGREYAWLTAAKLTADLPILGITKRAASERLQKLADFGILDRKILRDERGTFCLYGFGPNYGKMVNASEESEPEPEAEDLHTATTLPRSSDTPTHVQTAPPPTSEPHPLPRSSDTPTHVQTWVKDKTIINKTTRDKTTRDIDDTPTPPIPPAPPKARAAPDGFDRFWAEYPRKTAKARARKAWEKIRPDAELAEKIIQGLVIAKARDTRFREERFTPHPATWLNGGEWENEYGGTESHGNQQTFDPGGFRGADEFDFMRSAEES